MSDNLPISLLPEDGFWAVVHHSRIEEFTMVGFVSTAKLGPFDFLRVDYREAQHQGFPTAGDPNEVATALFPQNALPVIHVISEEEARASASPGSQELA